MEIINGPAILNKKIKESISEKFDETLKYPRMFYFCKKLGCKTFKITIEQIDKDVFIDKDGHTWIKQK